MKKVGVLLFLMVLLAFPVIAQESGSISEAISCLEDQISNKSSESFSLEEAVFTTLALGSEKKLTDKIEDEMSNQNCWPKSSCAIKDTAQVLIAYDQINKDTEDIEDYLLSKNQSASELTWFLQIDIQNHVASTCTAKYDDRDYQIEIGEDMKISGGAGSCLSLSSSGYWLQISRSCLEKTFQVSCEQDFITSLLYQKSGSQTIYVSSDTHSASSSGTTEEKVNSQCFGIGSSCNYEGTLWAALALQRAGYESSNFFPYLLAFAEDNKKLFPASFLYLLTSADDQYSEIIDSQKQSNFWEAPGTKYNKFYDTALGLLSLQGTSAAELENAKTYLLSIQTPEGCWNNNNIRDTGFLVYAGWGGTSSDGGDNGGSSRPSCEESGFYCGGLLECQDSGGEVFNDLDCTGLQYCCSVPLIEQTCAEQNGIVCSFGQECTGTTVSSLDGSCCLDSCQDQTTTTECENFGGLCSFSCDSGYEESTESCQDSGLVCCFESTDSGGSSLVIWIIVLIILIALIGAGIFYRDKIRMWMFKLSNRGGPSEPPSEGPRAPPRGPPRRPRGPPIARRPLARRQTRRPISKADKDMEDTLKKLKEMSK